MWLTPTMVSEQPPAAGPPDVRLTPTMVSEQPPAAGPPDVRQGFALPEASFEKVGLSPRFGLSPDQGLSPFNNSRGIRQGKPCLTSGGGAGVIGAQSSFRFDFQDGLLLRAAEPV